MKTIVNLDIPWTLHSSYYGSNVPKKLYKTYYKFRGDNNNNDEDKRSIDQELFNNVQDIITQLITPKSLIL